MVFLPQTGRFSLLRDGANYIMEIGHFADGMIIIQALFPQAHPTYFL